MGRGIEVLLGPDERLGRVNDRRVVAELVDDDVGEDELGRVLSDWVSSNESSNTGLEWGQAMITVTHTFSQALAPANRTPGDGPAKVTA